MSKCNSKHPDEPSLRCVLPRGRDGECRGPKKAIGMGYVIADEDGRVQLHTLRGNRAASWKVIAETPEARERLKRMGFRCTFVNVQQSGRI